MKTFPVTLAILSPLMLVASCGAAGSGETNAVSTPAPSETASGKISFSKKELASFDEPWGAAFAPGTSMLFVTEKGGTLRSYDMGTGRTGTVTGAPKVDYGGQGGLGDIAFLPAEAASTVGSRTIYLSWVEAGSGDTRGAVVGRGTLACDNAGSCRIDNLNIIWRQQPKVTGRGHYSHRLAISPDGKYLFVSSGERQKGDPAQDTSNNLGSIVRLNLDGTPAAGNPFSGQSGKAQDIWSYGHRNTLGIAFDSSGQLWNLEHGPAGGDEINRIEAGRNYGWPLVSGGDNYDGTPIPRNETRPDLAGPAINWTPVIAPGDFIIYSGNAFPALKGEALITGLKTEALIQVRFNGDTASEVARYPMGSRIREIVQAPDGSILILEDGENGKLIQLSPT